MMHWERKEQEPGTVLVATVLLDPSSSVREGFVVAVCVILARLGGAWVASGSCEIGGTYARPYSFWYEL